MYEINVSVKDRVDGNKYLTAIKQMKELKALADSGVEECKQKLFSMGVARYEEIKKQLQPIIDGLRAYCVATEDYSSLYVGMGRNYRLCLESYVTRVDVKIETYSIGHLMSKTDFLLSTDKFENWCSPDGFITHWNEYDVIESLDKQLSHLIYSYAEKNAEKAKTFQNACDNYN